MLFVSNLLSSSQAGRRDVAGSMCSYLMLVLQSGFAQICVAVWNHPGGGDGGASTGVQK
jgi:hypothetical protein